MPPYGPLVLSPRLDAKLWGGRSLAEFGFDLPPGEAIGEALITADEAVVQSGDHTGRRLGDLIANDPEGIVGERGAHVTRGLPFFPMLIKLIDATEDLSIQVHPTDETAPAGSLGKTEAWHVLRAEPHATLYLGLADGVDTADIAATARRGESTAHLMRAVPATPGATYLLPAGTVHALGAGITIYEIQQPSAITYRLDDWGRVDSHGVARELHVDAGLAVLDATSHPEAIMPVALPIDSGSRVRLVRSAFFAAERLVIDTGETATLDGAEAPQAFTCLAGRLDVSASDISVSIGAGETAVTAANSGTVAITASGETTVLRGWLDPEG